MEMFATDLNTANTLLATMAAIWLTLFWLRIERTPAIGWWTLAAWTAAASVGLVVLRPLVSAALGIAISTALYTATHVLLIFGLRTLAGPTLPIRSALVVIAGHLVFLIWAVAVDLHPESRMVFNSALWSALSLVAAAGVPAVQLGETSAAFRLPRFVLLVHGGFHGLRFLLLLTFLPLSESSAFRPVLQSVSFIETSLFVVGVFSGLVILRMLERNRQLAQALTEIKTLSGLLPICAWCKKIRDQEGYWKQVEDYLATHTCVEFTHGICTECSARVLCPGEQPSPGVKPGPTAEPNGI